MAEEYPQTDVGRARTLVDDIKGTYVYVPEHKDDGWTWYDGKIWNMDKRAIRVSGAAVRLLEEKTALAAQTGDRRQETYWEKCQSADVIRNAIGLARSMVIAKPDDFDVDDDLMCCQNCVLNLRTGETFPHDPSYMMTRITRANYNPSAQCPHWDEYLEHTIPDPSTREFLQRAAGYSLTPYYNEQVFFMLAGGEGTGKSTFVEVLAFSMGTYAQSCSPETLTTNKGGVRSDLAVLRGARLVRTQELKHRDELDLSLVKRLTGEEMMSAAFKYHDEIEFWPQWKTWISYNHAPQIPADSTGLWRRIRLVEFDQYVKTVDKKFREKLLSEIDGVLAWAMRGALTWFSEGLSNPESVRISSKRFRSRKDSIYAFVEDRCTLDPSATWKTMDLYNVYRGHCETTLLVQPVVVQLFSEVLAHLEGVKVTRTARRSYTTGLALRRFGPSLNPHETSDKRPWWADQVDDQESPPEDGEPVE